MTVSVPLFHVPAAPVMVAYKVSVGFAALILSIKGSVAFQIDKPAGATCAEAGLRSVMLVPPVTVRESSVAAVLGVISLLKVAV